MTVIASNKEMVPFTPSSLFHSMVSLMTLDLMTFLKSPTTSKKTTVGGGR